MYLIVLVVYTMIIWQHNWISYFKKDRYVLNVSKDMEESGRSLFEDSTYLAPISYVILVKVKVFPLQARLGPEGG